MGTSGSVAGSTGGGTAACLAARCSALSAARCSARSRESSSLRSRQAAKCWYSRPSRLIGPASRRATIATENVEIKYSDKIRQIPVSSMVPMTFNEDRSESAIRIPTNPPAENAPFQGRHNGRMESAVDALRKSRAAPNTLTEAAWMGWERIHFQASSHSRTGRLKALRPSNWKQKSAVYDPASPVRLCACAAPVTEFQEGSCG